MPGTGVRLISSVVLLCVVASSLRLCLEDWELVSASREELTQQSSACITENIALHSGMVIQAGLREQIDYAPARTGLGIRCSVHDALHARMHERARAHRARLQRDVQRRTR